MRGSCENTGGGGGQADVGGREGGTAAKDGLRGRVKGRSGVAGHHMAPLRVDGTSRQAFPLLPTHHPKTERPGLKDFLPCCHVSDTEICSQTVLPIRCVKDTLPKFGRVPCSFPADS